MNRKTDFFSYSLLVAIFFCLFSPGCSKSAIEQAQQANAQNYFEDNFLNRDYIVHLATDNGADLTAQYTGFVFRLVKGTSFDGPINASKNGTTYTGSWSTNADYSKLVISLPVSVPEFIFLVREWKFTRKGIPILELAPWGTTEAKVLHMERL
ncbi:MAG: hypothetical protein IPI66_08800 [Chitinophagaceae bacterium]|nr:hypothetical protein [Chitinophagaceae bacterium]